MQVSSYNEILEAFERFCTFSTEKNSIIQNLQHIVTNKDTVLDIGAGTGCLTIPLAKIARKVVALEPSREALTYLERKALKNKLTNIEFIKSKWEKIGHIGTFDIVLCSHTIYHLRDWSKVIRKMLQISRKHAIVVVHCKNDEFHKFLGTFWYQVHQYDYPNTHNHSYILDLIGQMKLKPYVKFIDCKLSIPNVREAMTLCKFFFEKTDFQSGVQKKLYQYFVNKETGQGISINYRNAIIIFKPESKL